MCLSRSETACAFWARGCPQPGSPHCRVGGHDIERPGCMPAVTLCSDCGDTTCSGQSLDLVTRFEAYIAFGTNSAEEKPSTLLSRKTRIYSPHLVDVWSEIPDKPPQGCSQRLLCRKKFLIKPLWRGLAGTIVLL